MSSSEASLNQIIRESVLKSLRIEEEEVSEIQFQDTGSDAKGFTGETKCVTVKLKGRPPLHLFIKVTQPKDSPHAELISDEKAYEKEARFLTEYVKAAKDFCMKKGLPTEFGEFCPHCYYGDENVIIMENLVIEKGAKMMNLDKEHDLETAKYVKIKLIKIGFFKINAENLIKKQFNFHFLQTCGEVVGQAPRHLLRIDRGCRWPFQVLSTIPEPGF